MRNIWSNAFTVAIVFGLFAIIAIGGLQREYERPGPLEAELLFKVPSGATLSAIAKTLHEDGAITSAWLFNAAARRQGVASSLKAGEYAIPEAASMRDILEKITDGRAVQHRVTVAEGLSSAEIVALLQEPQFDGILVGEIEETPAEGTLAPETYFVQRGETRAAVLKRMADAQTEILDTLWATRAADLPLADKQEALILASIVEKETGVDGERAKVASVFINRLRRPMRLQSDPTIIYGITKGEKPLGRGLRRSEIDDATNVYNTYQIDRLPPGPIANPGRASIAAVMNPATTDYIYFVADGGGGHAFSKTLDEHNRNVAVWRRIERERQQN